MRVDLHRCIVPSFYIVVQLAVPYASRHAGLDTTTNRTSRQSVGGKAVTNHRRRARRETVMALMQMRFAEAAAAATDADRADDRPFEAYVGVHVRNTQGQRGQNRLRATQQPTRAKLLRRRRRAALAYR